MGTPIYPSSDCHTQVRTWPYEDVFAGLLLANAPPINGTNGGALVPRVALDLGRGAFHGNMRASTLDDQIASSVLVWHHERRAKNATLLQKMHKWAANHRTLRTPRRLDCHDWVGCTGAAWRRCGPVW